MIDKLKVKKVVLIDFQEPYSVGLSDAVEAVAEEGRRHTTRLSAPNTTTDYSAYVTKVPSDADIVFFPTQKPGDAQTFAQQLLEQGKKAKVFGGDGSNDPAQFKRAGLVRVELRPGHQPASPPTRRSSPAGRRTTPASRSARSGRRPTEPSRSLLQRDQEGLRRRPRRDQEPPRRAAQGEAGVDQELDPRRHLPLLDEVERPAEREVLHLPDPVERLVQARRLDELTTLTAEGRPGMPGRPSHAVEADPWTPSSSSPSTR